MCRQALGRLPSHARLESIRCGSSHGGQSEEWYRGGGITGLEKGPLWSEEFSWVTGQQVRGQTTLVRCLPSTYGSKRLPAVVGNRLRARWRADVEELRCWQL